MSSTDSYRFFEDLEAYLRDWLVSRGDLAAQIQDYLKELPSRDRKTEQLEWAFMRYIAKPIHTFLVENAHLRQDGACHALLHESYKRLPSIASSTPASEKKHPFTKVIGVTPKVIMRRWWGESRESIASQSCPDMALRLPCRFRTVFEGKYFRKGGKDAAETALVTGIYQTFFYLGLPRRQKAKKHAEWDYEYGCFLAYDATEGHHLIDAWGNINKNLKIPLWEGANIFVMILSAKH